jgi:hypothetical protein
LKSDKKYLLASTKIIQYLVGAEDVELDYPFDDIYDWRFYSCNNEIFAEYVGKDPDQDELELVWYGGKERYWGVTKHKDDVTV